MVNGEWVRAGCPHSPLTIHPLTVSPPTALTCALEPDRLFLMARPRITGPNERRMYAIFKALGKQFRAEKGATLQLPYMEEKQPGDALTFDEVLLTSNGDTITAGAPMVSGAKVMAEVVDHGKEKKIYVFKFKRRKNYRRKTGHRQKFTEVKITDVVLG